MSINCFREYRYRYRYVSSGSSRFGPDAQGLARRLKVAPEAEEWQIILHAGSTAELSHQLLISPWPKRRSESGCHEGLSTGKNKFVASSEASWFLNVLFLSSICSVIWVQNPHVSFPPKRAVFYMVYKPAHVALYNQSREVLDSELTMLMEAGL
jgi:hypothetical protein